MHVISTEQIALIAIVFVVAFASTLSRSIRDGDRRSYLRFLGLGFSSGFFCVGLYCVGDVYAARIFGAGSNLFWIGVASLIGFTAQMQDKIGSELFVALVNRILGTTISGLSAIKTMTAKKDDDKPSDTL